MRNVYAGMYLLTDWDACLRKDVLWSKQGVLKPSLMYMHRIVIYEAF